MCRTLLVSDPVFADSSTHCNDIFDVYILSGCCMRASISFFSNRAIGGAAKYLTQRLSKTAPIRVGVTKVVTPGLSHLRPVETNPQQFERATPAVEELTLYY